MNKLLYVGLVSLMIFSACNLDKQKPEDLVASAFGNKLYKNQLESVGSKHLSAADSISAVQRQIDNWLMQEILYNESKRNLKPKDKIERLVESYKKSLYIHELEKIQLTESLDTMITLAELDTFYNQHKKDFLLDEGIAKLLFVKLPDSLDNENLETLWKTENLPALKTFVKANNGIQLLDLDKWYYLSEIVNLSPSELVDKIDFDKTESYSLTKDGAKFLIRILDYADKKEIAPKSFAYNKIKLRLLHDRSTNLLNKWKKDLYQNNIQSKNIIIN